MKKIIGIALGAAFVLAAAAGPASAMPAFARKYAMTCKTCHAPFPKLKPYGEEFAANGFVIKDKETPRYYVDAGDDQLSLLRDVPFAFRLEGFLSYDNGRSKALDFSAPYILKFLSGGEITKHLSYYFYFFFGERGEVAGLEDAFLMLNDIFGPDLDLYVGQFQVSDPLFKREVRLPFEDYRIYTVKVGSSKANLTYDRGVMATLGLKSGTDICFEIVNGSGLDPTNPFGNFDGDRYKNVLFRLSQDVGSRIPPGRIRVPGKGEAGGSGEQPLDGRRRRHAGRGPAPAQPSVRGAEGRQPVLLRVPPDRDPHPGRVRRARLPAGRGQQPLVRRGAFQYRGFRAGGPQDHITDGSCGLSPAPEPSGHGRDHMGLQGPGGTARKGRDRTRHGVLRGGAGRPFRRPASRDC